MCVAGGHKRKRRQKREKGGCGSPYMITRKIHIMKQWSHTTRRRILNIYHVHTRVHDIVSLFGASGLGSNLIILRVCARAARAAQLCHALRPKLSKSETKVLQNFKPGTRMKRQMLQWWCWFDRRILFITDVGRRHLWDRCWLLNFRGWWHISSLDSFLVTRWVKTISGENLVERSWHSSLAWPMAGKNSE